VRRNAYTVVLGTPLLGAIALAVTLSGCGEAATVSTSTVINLESTNYFTIPPTPSTIATTTTAPPPPMPGQPTVDVTLYQVQPGDSQSLVADLYNITLDQLNAANFDTPGYEAFLVGITIKIPPGATIPTTTAPLVDPATGLCVKGKYVLESGDSKSGVAADFEVSLDDLNKINANTQGYEAFIVGIEILIPGTDC